MLVKEFGDKSKKAIVLIHGGGLSWWQWEKQIELFKNEYRLIVPVIDGHGEDCDTVFLSIKDSAEKLISYIKKECDSKVLALCGLSIGAQIVVEMLANSPDIAEYAIIESALVYPMNFVSKAAKFACDLTYPLISKRWFAKMQAKTLLITDDMFETYFEQSSAMKKETLINITKSNSSYPLPEKIKDTTARTLVLVGGKEVSIMKKSAKLLAESIKNSKLNTLENFGHGELSVRNPEEYTEVVLKFIS